jgi:uncharacterized protein (UPF0264 family)
MTGLLASVATVDEARQAAALGADILDLKDPAKGALGAWAPDDIAAAVEALGRSAVLSATTGDLPMRPEILVAAVALVGRTGVAYVKVGFFLGGDHAACARALAPLAARGVRLVAVLMADQGPDLGLLPHLARAGFAGAMLDTADKAAGSLRRHLDDRKLARFAHDARRFGLLAGLAGSLTIADIAPLAALGPDYLGFRRALCAGARTAALDPEAFAAVRAALDSARSNATAAAGAQVAAAAAS